MKLVFVGLLAGLFPVAAIAASPAATPAATPAPAAAPTGPIDPTKAIINVTVDNVETDEGAVRVALCNKALSQDGCQFFIEIPAAKGSVVGSFENITPGQWAVAAFHDKNKSGEMDTVFGIPREPYALSNNATEHMIPTLKDALIKIVPGPNEVELKLGLFGQR